MIMKDCIESEAVFALSKSFYSLIPNGSCGFISVIVIPSDPFIDLPFTADLNIFGFNTLTTI